MPSAKDIIRQMLEADEPLDNIEPDPEHYIDALAKQRDVPVHADLVTDDEHITLGFECQNWFKQAPDAMLLKCHRKEWGRDYEFDAIAQFMEHQNPELEKAFVYIQQHDTGYEVWVNDEEAYCWIMLNRPYLLEQMGFSPEQQKIISDKLKQKNESVEEPDPEQYLDALLPIHAVYKGGDDYGHRWRVFRTGDGRFIGDIEELLGNQKWSWVSLSRHRMPLSAEIEEAEYESMEALLRAAAPHVNPPPRSQTLEAEEPDIDPQHYVDELPPTFTGLLRQNGFDEHNRIYSRLAHFAMDTRNRQYDSYWKVALVSYLAHEQGNIVSKVALELHGKQRFIIDTFACYAATERDAVKALASILPACKALLQALSSLNKRGLNIGQFADEVAALPEHKAVMRAVSRANRAASGGVTEAVDEPDYERYVDELQPDRIGFMRQYGGDDDGNIHFPFPQEVLNKIRADDPDPTRYNELVVRLYTKEDQFSDFAFICFEVWGNLRGHLLEIEVRTSSEQSLRDCLTNAMPAALALAKAGVKLSAHVHDAVPFRDTFVRLPQVQAARAAIGKLAWSVRESEELPLDDPESMVDRMMEPTRLNNVWELLNKNGYQPEFPELNGNQWVISCAGHPDAVKQFLVSNGVNGMKVYRGNTGYSLSNIIWPKGQAYYDKRYRYSNGQSFNMRVTEAGKVVEALAEPDDVDPEAYVSNLPEQRLRLTDGCYFADVSVEQLLKIQAKNMVGPYDKTKHAFPLQTGVIGDHVEIYALDMYRLRWYRDRTDEAVDPDDVDPERYMAKLKPGPVQRQQWANTEGQRLLRDGFRLVKDAWNATSYQKVINGHLWSIEQIPANHAGGKPMGLLSLHVYNRETYDSGCLMHRHFHSDELDSYLQWPENLARDLGESDEEVDPEAYLGQNFETWIATFRRHGWRPWGPHDNGGSPYYWKWAIPTQQRDDPIEIFAQHGYDEAKDQSEDDDEGFVNNIRRRNVNMPDHVQFGLTGSSIEFTVPPTSLGAFLTALMPKLKALQPPRWSPDNQTVWAAIKSALAEAGLPETGNMRLLREAEEVDPEHYVDQLSAHTCADCHASLTQPNAVVLYFKKERSLTGVEKPGDVYELPGHLSDEASTRLIWDANPDRSLANYEQVVYLCAKCRKPVKWERHQFTA